MATMARTDAMPGWIEKDPELESSMEMDDDELEFDTFDAEEGDLDSKTRKVVERDYVPLWRLIEMSREDRSLRMELADFEDYEDSDRVDEYAGGLSH
jgi:hypothetical protein